MRFVFFSFILLFPSFWFAFWMMLFLTEIPERFSIYRKTGLVVAVMTGSAQHRTVINVKIQFVIDMAGNNVMGLEVPFRAAGLASVILIQ